MKQFLFVALLLPAAAFGAPKRAVYVGDSHSYIKALAPPADQRRLGNVLIDGLKVMGYDVWYYAACGSTPEDWAKGGMTGCGFTKGAAGAFESPVKAPIPLLTTFYDPAKVSRMIVNLGDNMFTWSNVDGKKQAAFDTDKFQRNMRDFFESARGLAPGACTWIGPTYHVEGATYRKPNKAVDALYTALKKFLEGRCRLVDSRALVVTSTPNDGLHHVAADSRLWGEGILAHLGN